MKTITNIIYSAFALVALAVGTLTANAEPGDLIAADMNGNIIQLPINPPFGTPSSYWDNANLPRHSWQGIAFDQAGNLYASDDLYGQPGTGAIWKLPPDRSGWILFATGLNNPRGLAVDAEGNLYEADTTNTTYFCDNGYWYYGAIYKFTPDGARTTFASGIALEQGFSSMVFDSLGNLFVPGGGDCGQGSPPVAIYKITPQGAISVFCSLPLYGFASGITFDSGGNLFVLKHNGLNGHNQLLGYPPPRGRSDLGQC